MVEINETVNLNKYINTVVRGEYFSLFPNISLGKNFPLFEDLGKSLAILKLHPFINV